MQLYFDYVPNVNGIFPFIFPPRIFVHTSSHAFT